MSLNIKTATGLLEIGGNVTKEKVVSALGYEPADKEVETTVDTHTKDANIHIASNERALWNKGVEDLDLHKSDTSVHVTSAERQAWDNKSDFSGAYADLIDAPNITENDSGNMVIADESGNIIMQVDADGLTTTNVTTKTIELDGKDLGTRLDELESTSLPNILDNESGDLTVSDESGNVIMKVDEDGLTTTFVTVQGVDIGGLDVGATLITHAENIGDISEDLTEHTTDSTVHITADERTLWNNKSDFSGDYNDLTNAPDIKEDGSGEVVYADESGNIIVRIGEAGLETTQVVADTVTAGGVDVGSTLSSHIDNTDIHITATERQTWNAKASTTYVDEKVANLVNSAPEALNTLDELAAALGDDENFATTVTNEIAKKADQTSLDAHTANKNNPHAVSASQIGLGNVDNTSDLNKPISTAQQAALNNLKTELSESIVSDAKEWIVADEAGNIVAKIDESGLETTAVIIDGVDVATSLDKKLEANDISHLASTSYVNTEIAKKADVIHYHEQYLEASDIADLASTTYVDEKVSIKANQADLNSHINTKTNPHEVTKVQVGLGNVDNTADANKPVSTAQQEALDNLKSELSESIVSESSEWTVADKDGNIVARVDSNGLKTTTIEANELILAGEAFTAITDEEILSLFEEGV